MSSYGQVYASQIASEVVPSGAMQTGATANGNGTPLVVSGYATSNLAISGSFVGTINFEASVDGSTWVSIRGVRVDSATGSTTATDAGVFVFNCAGLTQLRARISNYVSGSITVEGYVSPLVGISPSDGGGGGGGDVNLDEVAGNAVSVANGTTDSGTLRVTISSDSTGVVGLASGTTIALAAGSKNIGSITDITGSVSLPTGAATSAKQPAFGTAGTASNDVLTVQGRSGMVALAVDGSGATQPVSAASLPLPSGASTAAKQPALGTAGSASADVITVQGIASMTALKVDGSAVTQPISASALPLPTGASTAAKQPSLGTAGSASADVITVQGIASMTPLKVDASGVSLTVTMPALELAQDSATSGQTGPLIQGAVSTSAPTYTNTKTNPLSLTTSGALRVDASATTVPVSASSLPLPSGAATAAKQPALGTAGTASADVLTVQGHSGMVALSVDGSAVTQPISASALPLPTGAATAAKQPALGTAGSPSSDVISVQGVASGTPMPVSLPGNQAVNLAQIGGATAATGSGSSTSGTMRVVTSSDSSIAQTASIVPTFTTLQNAATGNGNGTAINTTGYGTCLFSITGSLGGGTTINFESSADGGTTWVSILGTQVGSSTSATTTTNTGDWVFSCAAQSQLRARISSYGSGTITVKGFLSVIVPGSGGSGGGGGGGSVNITQVNSNTVATGNGAANSGTQRVAIASDSVLSSTMSPPTRSTYSANTNGSFSPLTSATDMIIFTGSSTKTVKILEIHLAYEVSSSGAANGNRFFLIRRSSANSGGTPTTETIVSMDTNNSAATAIMKSYRSGSNPTLGTTVGTIWTGMIGGVCPPSFLQSVNADLVIFNAAEYGQPIVLRGTAESICLNNGGVTVAGTSPKVGLIIYFTEE